MSHEECHRLQPVYCLPLRQSNGWLFSTHSHHSILRVTVEHVSECNLNLSQCTSGAKWPSNANKRQHKVTLFLLFIAGSVKCQTAGRVAHHHFIRPSQDQLTLSESIARGAAVQHHQEQHPNHGHKGEEKGSLDFTCPTQFGHYRDTSNCAAYFICTFGQVLHKNCSTGLYFSERLQTCDWPTNVPCERGKSSSSFFSSSLSFCHSVSFLSSNKFAC